MSQYKLVRFNLNGKDVEKMVDVRASLTDMLRNDYHMTSVKKGCEVGECGACNVIIDGEAFNSCIYLAVWADGKHIRTLESLMGPDGELSDIQQAFIEETAFPHNHRAPRTFVRGALHLNARRTTCFIMERISSRTTCASQLVAARQVSPASGMVCPRMLAFFQTNGHPAGNARETALASRDRPR